MSRTSAAPPPSSARRRSRSTACRPDRDAAAARTRGTRRSRAGSSAARSIRSRRSAGRRVVDRRAPGAETAVLDGADDFDGVLGVAERVERHLGDGFEPVGAQRRGEIGEREVIAAARASSRSAEREPRERHVRRRTRAPRARARARRPTDVAAPPTSRTSPASPRSTLDAALRVATRAHAAVRHAIAATGPCARRSPSTPTADEIGARQQRARPRRA